MLFCAGFVLPIAFAQQQNAAAPPQPTSESTTQVQRIVDQCSFTGAVNSCAKVTIKRRTLSIPVPDFKPGDENTHVYVVSGILQSGCSGASTAHPDEYGLIEEMVAVSEASAGGNSCQYYLMVMDNKTLDTRVTLDLYQVKVVPFLTSLEGAMQFGVRVATKQRSAYSPGSGLGDAHTQYRERYLSIRGDNLTIDEVLDRIYQNTGCIVDREAERMALASCR